MALDALMELKAYDKVKEITEVMAQKDNDNVKSTSQKEHLE